MKRGWHDLELLVDRLIPYTLLILLLILIGEIFFWERIRPYHFWIDLLDLLIILVFACDLYFKYKRVKNIKKFLKKYWLDIIAIFPFFLIFKIVEETALLTQFFRETIIPGQKVLHEGLGVQEGATKLIEGVRAESRVVQGLEKEGAKIVVEVEKFGKISRTEELYKFIRPVTRIPRSFKFLSRDAHSKLNQEIQKVEGKINQEAEDINKLVQKEEKKIKNVIKKEEKKVGRFWNAFIFYEKPTGSHHVHENN